MMVSSNIRLGLRENALQFALLVLVNAFVGGMIGMERTIFPNFAETVFHISSKTAILSFISAFGFSKALANYLSGRWANALGRRNILLIGWLIAIPIPFILIYAPTWNWVIMANVLLGFSQGLTWSSTVVIKIDLVGDKNRGLAMGLNEFAGYLSVGLVAFLTSWVVDQYGITPYPFYLGIFLSFAGFITTLVWIKDTHSFVQIDQNQSQVPFLPHIFWDTSLRNKTLSSVTQAGLINNLNDGMIWGLLPIFLSSLAFDTQEIGSLAAIYPSIWGIGQLVTGRMADIYSKKAMLFWGMLLQGLAIMLIPFLSTYSTLAILSASLGIGTALVYPTFLSTIASATRPIQRAESLGTFRLWRDLGYAIGAILSGMAADQFGIGAAIQVIGALTIGSAVLIHFRMPKGI
ncbi:MAG: MFS transporter [Spirosomataceae bacterium]